MRLTFDDGPGPGTGEILDALAAAGRRATFFMIGEEVEKRPGLARRVGEEGHILGNHTHTHPRLTELPPGRIAWEIDRCSEAIREASGRWPSAFRPPFGDLDDRVRGLAEGAGLEVVMWDADPRDWDLPGVDALAEALSSVGEDEVVILHDGGPSAGRQTVDALWRIATSR